MRYVYNWSQNIYLKTFALSSDWLQSVSDNRGGLEPTRTVTVRQVLSFHFHRWEKSRVTHVQRCSWLRLLSSIEFFNRFFFMNGLKFKTRETATITNVAVLHTTSPRTFQRSQDDVNCKDVKLRGLGLTLSHWWKVLWILRSFKKLEKVIYTVHSNTIYPWFLSKTKPKLVILHGHRSRCLHVRSSLAWQMPSSCLRDNSKLANPTLLTRALQMKILSSCMAHALIVIMEVSARHNSCLRVLQVRDNNVLRTV